MRRITLPLTVIGAVAAATIGLAAPASADVTTTPMRTLTNGLCINEVVAIARPGNGPGTLRLMIPDRAPLVGMWALSGECSVRVTLRWHNLDSGATGEDHVRYIVGISGMCDLLGCWESEYRTGSGRVAVEVASELPHLPGHAEVFVP